ncbi:decaprenyl-phosphate phosphoribosyltransferase [Paenibacillus sp. SYP-B3998]|uniref:Decaprenyl-phosphate phosphoribosyltransferase n=1 Tax=Paenibacillus sp. SYP-B3998 TaxID=2678564 RepID=A0A6G4A0B2_9BACL|nr:decaprenyl-phosphate phosphoribosyltransferase [Paenibacillus sp. SYP-B3998]NEW07087.1 decaprenyl-phosphate phosphoribosyltransferase [Paenibacillus sp. SYP-B3998]
MSRIIEYPNSKKVNVISLMFKQMRPKQWTKNILIYAALVFSIDTIESKMIWQSTIGFILFCLISSCVYILNDYLDIEADRNHPIKKSRPMASGLLNPNLAISVGVILLISSITIAFISNLIFGVILIIYFLLNVSYSISLKHVVIIDVMIIATGFVLRALGGGVIINVGITPWFLICTMLISLFLAISKRRHEFILSLEKNSSHRKVLQFYNLSLLDQMNSIVTTATIISYSLFTFTSGRSINLMWTIPLVVYGIFRYIYLLHVEGKGGSPDKLLFEDKHILITVFLYGLLVMIILKYF